ncbi:hypothetical protein H072_1644 [Dactylellina haptotyla CBS 200.50]|uniref:ATP-dependent RNA helicase DDX60 PIN-like domain-containing protein n=1 Tax=Dactylellina haptotyla (strain CBS 200.50) TaxID=1284197 RepID=S8ANG3_DACHA|nr:hypothetical protein H072_1644 [Dactylellina haptotyla CBS 200.50]
MTVFLNPTMEPNESTHKPSYEGLAHISSWYGGLRPLFLDLVGDYAGEELFFIEGDSLCLHVFGDTRIEITDGPAVVHGIYVMEKFLSNLKQRGCNFHIVFFEAHKLLSFDHGKVDSDKAFRYILIREAFTCHLQQSISSDNPVKVHFFNSLNDLAFKKYLDEAKPYFCMAHDATTTNGDRKEQYYLQSAILCRMMLNGYNIALLDTVEFKDSKAMTSVVEGHSFSQFTESIQRKVAEEMADAFKVLEHEFEFDEIYTTTEVKHEAEKYIKHPREYTVIAVLSGVANEDYKARSLVEKFGYAFLHHTVLMDTLSLEERCLPDIMFDSNKVGQLNNFINYVCRCMSFMLEDFSNFESLKQMYPDTTFNLCDIIDIRLFKYCLANQDFGDKALAVETLSKALEIQVGIELSPLPKKYLNARVVPRTGEGQSQLAVLPFNHPAFDSHLSVIKLDVDDEDFDTLAPLHQLAPEKTH